jgi:MoaA/NifB/PqqE/SkfB family radical SAM enzyme
MKYAIYGANRVSKDFLYIFDGLEIAFFIDDGYVGNEFLLYKVMDFKCAISKRNDYGRIIVCDFDKADKIEKLAGVGLIYGKDYLYEEDFFDQLDDWCIPSDRKPVIWGTGNNARKLASQPNAVLPDCYIDNNINIKVFNGIEVKHPDEIDDWKDYFIIIAVARYRDIKEQLEDYGLSENEDFISFYKYLGRPSELLRKTIFDRSCYDLNCDTMLNHLEILYEGNTRCCCTTFVSQNLDNIFEKEQQGLWHSNLHKIMCLSTENKTFSFCNKAMCPLFVALKEKYVSECSLEIPYKHMTESPEVLSLGYDSSCNLMCSTCRGELHFAKGRELERIKRITQMVERDYLPNCDFLILAGDGEVFAADSYRAIYESEKCNPKYIRLLSNGTLFTKERWDNFIRNKSCRVMLTVSIDAATKETYESIRRNGNFEKLVRNMQFASELRKNGQLAYFRMNFVVQRENYKEMVSFVEWGESLGVDEIFFTKILNWGTYTDEEFKNISMMEEDGVTPKAELLEVLENPIIKNSKIADFGTIRYGHRIDDVDYVQNYYMWELEKRGGKLFV